MSLLIKIIIRGYIIFPSIFENDLVRSVNNHTVLAILLLLKQVYIRIYVMRSNLTDHPLC